MELNVVPEITDPQINQLIEYTNSDPDIRKFTSDLKRFPDRASFENWSKDKSLYTLSDGSENLFGFIWFEKKQIPIDESQSIDPKEYQITIAVRIYGKIRGKGYFKKFLEKALEDFKDSNKFWVSIAKENIASYKAFKKFGFKEIRNSSDRILMIWES